MLNAAKEISLFYDFITKRMEDLYTAWLSSQKADGSYSFAIAPTGFAKKNMNAESHVSAVPSNATENLVEKTMGQTPHTLTAALAFVTHIKDIQKIIYDYLPNAYVNAIDAISTKLIAVVSNDLHIQKLIFDYIPYNEKIAANNQKRIENIGFILQLTLDQTNIQAELKKTENAVKDMLQKNGKNVQVFQQTQEKGVRWPHAIMWRRICERAGFKYKPWMILRDRMVCPIDRCAAVIIGLEEGLMPGYFHQDICPYKESVGFFQVDILRDKRVSLNHIMQLYTPIIQKYRGNDVASYNAATRSLICQLLILPAKLNFLIAEYAEIKPQIHLIENYRNLHNAYIQMKYWVYPAFFFDDPARYEALVKEDILHEYLKAELDKIRN